MSSADVQGTVTASTESDDESNQLAAVFTALGDETCRVVLRTLRATPDPLTVNELSDAADVTLTSTYRKIDRLSRAGLVEVREGVDPDGHRRARYRPVVDRIEVDLGSIDCPEVTLFRSVNALGVEAL